jgi:phosphate transport system protein
MTTAVRSTFEKQLQRLNDHVLKLGTLARQAVASGMLALDEGNIELAREVVAGDLVLNRLRFSIEGQCYALIATEQPVAGDLRAIVAALTIGSDLERIGDHGKRIAKIALRMAETPRPIFMGSIPRMGDLSLAMLDRALRAMVTRDLAEARSICQADDQVDDLYKESFNVLLTRMLDERRAISAGTYLIQVAHELERVGDRATNIAERVIYSVTGELADLNV